MSAFAQSMSARRWWAFFGAALAIVGGRDLAGGFAWGYLPALGSAFIWASYSLLTKRVAHFPTAAIG